MKIPLLRGMRNFSNIEIFQIQKIRGNKMVFLQIVLVAVGGGAFELPEGDYSDRKLDKNSSKMSIWGNYKVNHLLHVMCSKV